MTVPISTFIFIIATSLVARSQVPDTSGSQRPTRWDLQTCLDYAKKNNITLNGLRLTEKTTEQNYELSKAAQQPNLTGNSSLSYTHSKAATAVIGGVQTQSSWIN